MNTMKKLFVEIKSIVFYGSNPSFCKLFNPVAVSCLVVRVEEFSTPNLDLVKIGKAPPSQKMRHRPEKVEVGWRQVRTVGWMRQQFDWFEFSNFFLSSSGGVRCRVVLLQDHPLSVVDQSRVFLRESGVHSVELGRVVFQKHSNYYYCLRRQKVWRGKKNTKGKNNFKNLYRIVDF